MKREGNEIKFNSDEQRRMFLRAVAIGDHLEDLLKAVFASAAEMREGSATWWREAERLCGPNERPIYDYVTETLRIETTEPPPEKSTIELLREAKIEAVATGQFALAGRIKDLIDSHEPATECVTP